jgi:hypothetical protein
MIYNWWIFHTKVNKKTTQKCMEKAAKNWKLGSQFELKMSFFGIPKYWRNLAG